jgi:glycogen debranching enzyme
MTPEIPEFEIPAREDRDWAYGRTARAALLVPSAEWVQSVYTCEFDLDGRRFLAPNRDYPYEGLLVHFHGENWKFIDAVAISVSTTDGGPLRLRYDDPATCVRVTPFQATYWYSFEEVTTTSGPVAPRLYVAYALDSRADAGTVTGRVKIGVANPWPAMANHLELAIQPFLDLRHMFSAAEFEKYFFETTNSPARAARVRVHNRTITFHFPEGELTRFYGPERLSWWYKLGTGQRAEVPDGTTGRTSTQFLGERKEVAAFFRFCPHIAGEAPSVTVRFACQLEDQPQASFSLPDYESLENASNQRHASLWRRAREIAAQDWSGEQQTAAAGRVVGLANMRIFASPAGSQQLLSVPPAGGWWFRTPWFRDIFEGLLSSFRTLMRLEGERIVIPAAVGLALGYQHPVSGLVPNRVPEFNDSQPAYDGSDATLLCLIAGLRYARETGDRAFARRVLFACVRAINRFRKAFLHTSPTPGGGPRLMPETGLLLTCPRHSWIDTSNQEVWYAGQHMKGLPNRASPTFVEDLYESLADARQVEWVLSTPSFFMPELNAQWLILLNLMRDVFQQIHPTATARRAYASLSELIEHARRSYMEIFWNNEVGFLYNLVVEDRSVRDSVDCEAAVVAAGILGSTLFSLQQLESIWRRVQAELLVRRRLVRLGDAWLPFGVLAMKLGKRVFYGDPEYHADTVWLRSTPYLISLLRSLGRHEEAKAVALNALDHQMSESAIFYNQELLAPPFGNNPAPDERTCRNPVPVKNPLQFWSQWCDGVLP